MEKDRWEYTEGKRQGEAQCGKETKGETEGGVRRGQAEEHIYRE